MTFDTHGNKGKPSLLLIPGLGVSCGIFLPLIGILKDRFHIIAAGIDGFLPGKESAFTSVDDQAGQIINYVRKNLDGRLDIAYGLSLGGKILSRILERDEIAVDHAILDAAPLLPLPRWSVDPLRYYQSLNVWTCYHWTGFWRRVFHSHYIDVLLDECRKVWPYGKGKAVRDGYKDVYTHKLESIQGTDIHYWYGSKEAFVAKAQARHLCALHPDTQVEVFPGMNHGQFLIDHPEEVAKRLEAFRSEIADNRPRVARRGDWKTEPMPERHETFVLDRSFSDREMDLLRRGNIPQAMEDKWFWYMEGSTLWAHRSWTGHCIYRIDFKEDNHHVVTVNRDPEQYKCTRIEEDIESLNKLLDWWTEPPYDYYNEWLSETHDALSSHRS